MPDKEDYPNKEMKGEEWRENQERVVAVLGEEGSSPESWTAAPYTIGTFPTALNWLADITTCIFTDTNQFIGIQN